ncbi:porin [Pinibacter soli]|nr:porin [Pinibacter soli]
MLAVIACLSSLMASAQNIKADTVNNYSSFKRSLSIFGLLQVRDQQSLTKNVDVTGKNFNPSLTKGVDNSFSLKRARLGLKGNINDQFSANLLINFADFSNTDIANRVLENAFVKYSKNKYLNIQVGQFRPFFGVEDLYPAEYTMTWDYSNQYNLFGSSGWQSFQLGATVFGDVTNTDKGQIPLRYYAGVYNGNNRNKQVDNDKTKNVYARLETDILKKAVTISVNGALGSDGGGKGNAWGADVVSKFRLAPKWKLFLNAEYKQGTNFALCNSIAPDIKKKAKDYVMQGFYVLPVISYELAKPRLRAIEFSSRYELLDENSKLQTSPHQTFTPNLSFIFSDNYAAVLMIGTIIDIYKNQVPLTTSYNKNIAYAQLQLKF